MEIKKFDNFRYIKEGKVITDPHQLLNRAENYETEIHSVVEKWKKNFFKILEEDGNYRYTAYKLDELFEIMKTDRDVVKVLIDNLTIHINKMNQEWMENQDDDPEKEELFDQLEDRKNELETTLEYMKDFKDSVKNVYDNYIELDENINSIRRFTIG